MEYFAKIYDDVLFNKEISDQSKLLYAVITKLSIKEGYTYARNKRFTENMGWGERKVQRYLEELRNIGYIREVITFDGNTRKILKRQIYPLTPGVKSDTTPGVTDVVYSKEIIYKEKDNKESNSFLSKTETLKSFGLSISYIDEVINKNQPKEKRKNLDTIINMCAYIKTISSYYGMKPVYDKDTIGATNIMWQKGELNNGLKDFYQKIEERRETDYETYKDFLRFDRYYLPDVIEDGF